MHVITKSYNYKHYYDVVTFSFLNDKINNISAAATTE